MNVTAVDITAATPLGSPTSAFPASAPVAEPTWERWASGLDPLALDGSSFEQAVVVAPHPDDETLGCGGLVHDLVRAGVEVRVVTVTNGEASHVGWPDLAPQRQLEQRAALAQLGVGSEPTVLGLPDGRVADHEHDLVAALRPLLQLADLVLAPWALDGHGDHDAVGRAVARVAEQRDLIFFAHPIWAWQWAAFDVVAQQPWQRWDLTADAQRAKDAAIAAHVSQTSEDHGAAVLTDDVLARSRRRWEVHLRVG